MKAFKPNNSSWHYRLMRGFFHKYPMPKDFCSYWREVVWECILVAVFVTLVLYLVVNFAVVLIYYPVATVKVSISILGIVVFIIAGSLLFVQIGKKLTQSKDSSSLILTKYHSFKEKTCIPVEYDDD